MCDSPEKIIGGGYLTDNCYFVLSDEASSFHCSDITDFYFKKERYTPYTYASGKFISAQPLENAYEVTCHINGKRIHQGLIDTLEKKFQNGRWIVSFRSRGYSVLLTQNEPVPNMNYNVNLTALSKINKTIPNVIYQASTNTVNYIYVKEKSTMWDAICAYGMKAYKILPYISSTNTVRVIPQTLNTHDFRSDKIIAYGMKGDSRSVLSDVYMANADGAYTYSKINTAADGKNIVRTRYYALDKQWLSSPDVGLTMKLNQSNRGYSQKFISYIGYYNQDIYDRAVFQNDDIKIMGEAIDEIQVTAKNNRIITTLSFYFDGNT